MKKRCSNCGYRGTLDGIQCCDYILVEKHMRPCPGGDGCAAWKPQEEVNKRARLVREEMERIVPTRNAALKTAEFRKKAKEKLTEEQRRERARERDRKYKAAHKNDPEYKRKITERARKYREKHKNDPVYLEKTRLRQREYRQRHLEEIRAKDRARRRKKDTENEAVRNVQAP